MNIDCGEIPAIEVFLTEKNVSEGKYSVPTPMIVANTEQKERTVAYDPHFSGGSKEATFGTFDSTKVSLFFFRNVNSRHLS